MRGVPFIALLLGTAVCGQGIRLGVERTRDLGYGFHRDVIAEAAPPKARVFESVGHFEYLFYRDRKLAAVNSCASLLAPDGRAIVYQEAYSGNIFLFERGSQKTLQLTHKFPGLAVRMMWRGPHQVAAFVVPSSQSPEGSGKWITLDIPKA